MILKSFFKNLKKDFNNRSFDGFEFNSKKIKKNYIFFAIQGSKFNGNNFINDAIKRGARIIVSNKFKTGVNKGVLYIKVSDPRLALSSFANKYYNKKPNNIIAVTGTNGKSSIVNFYYQILKLNKKRVASIGTLGVKSNGVSLKLNNTTVDAITINKILANLKKKKIENVILEASSHGLHQKRLHGIKFSTSIFTNLSRDHLDYHKNYKNYFNSKLILFNELTNKNGNLIFDNDLKYSQIFKKIAIRKKLNLLNIGTSDSHLKINSIKILNNYQHIKFTFQNKEYQFKTSLIGKIQIKNLMMAIAAAIKSNLKIDDIVKKLKYIKPAKGRLEIIGTTKDKSIFILDYAHTPEALKTSIENIKEHFGLRKINIVFGCGGERDKEKRPIMGKIANKLCNYIYLTDDNPRSENPENIRASIKKSILPSKMTEIPSRKLAIKKA
ncbi:UDP-N-acetylmuramoyl-L-alanyl-D-glutamate--2,6-diaminopimelate ligase, partial [Candidatus Pelagibacter sp.]|nr:UDP-N-acetylmuramoyl-L-alanyl-D-glutamate--2,6-diaminopimelate ligase [Candidatus Pelagibacter sp.]